MLGRLAVCSLCLGLGAGALAQPRDDHPLDLVDPDPPVAKRLAKRTLACPDGAAQRSEVGADGGHLWCETADGEHHGPYELWSRRGERIESGAYRRGLRHGAWTEWWPSGVAAARARFVDGVPDGEYEAFDATGERIESVSYRRGRVHGTWRRWEIDDAGRRYLQSERNYRLGRAHGRWRIGDRATGVHYDLRFFRGRPHGAWTFRVELERESLEIRGTYRHGRRHGRWVSEQRQSAAYPSRTRVVGRFDHGVEHGRWEVWTDGALTGWTTYRAGRRIRDDDAVPHDTIFDFVVDDRYDADPLEGRW